jgi:hypothetical protein
LKVGGQLRIDAVIAPPRTGPEAAVFESGDVRLHATASSSAKTVRGWRRCRATLELTG